MNANEIVDSNSNLDTQLVSKIKELVAFSGADPQSVEADLISQIIYASLKIANEGHGLGQIKLMTRAFKEMRYAYSVFNQYSAGRRISIFGSARTPEDHPDYLAARAFSSSMAALGWVCITGAANGIMKAGLEGAEKGSSFGLSIRLPFEETSNSLLAGDPKLITFRYFFTRKLMFLSHSDAVAAFPGGIGTQDELFEVLTLMQTGKANIIPVVLIEGKSGSYWQEWNSYIEKNLLANGWISKEDKNLFYIASTIEQAVECVQQFYHRYHSSRYVKDKLVIRLTTPLNEEQIAALNQKFFCLFQTGEISAVSALPEETDHLDLPRLAFIHNRKHFGMLRAMIDQINAF